jgi:hypothetical protein
MLGTGFGWVGRGGGRRGMVKAGSGLAFQRRVGQVAVCALVLLADSTHSRSEVTDALLDAIGRA